MPYPFRKTLLLLLLPLCEGFSSPEIYGAVLSSASKLSSNSFEGDTLLLQKVDFEKKITRYFLASDNSSVVFERSSFDLGENSLVLSEGEDGLPRRGGFKRRFVVLKQKRPESPIYYVAYAYLRDVEAKRDGGEAILGKYAIEWDAWDYRGPGKERFSGFGFTNCGPSAIVPCGFVDTEDGQQKKLSVKERWDPEAKKMRNTDGFKSMPKFKVPEGQDIMENYDFYSDLDIEKDWTDKKKKKPAPPPPPKDDSTADIPTPKPTKKPYKKVPQWIEEPSAYMFESVLSSFSSSSTNTRKQSVLGPDGTWDEVADSDSKSANLNSYDQRESFLYSKPDGAASLHTKRTGTLSGLEEESRGSVLSSGRGNQGKSLVAVNHKATKTSGFHDLNDVQNWDEEGKAGRFTSSGDNVMQQKTAQDDAVAAMQWRRKRSLLLRKKRDSGLFEVQSLLEQFKEPSRSRSRSKSYDRQSEEDERDLEGAKFERFPPQASKSGKSGSARGGNGEYSEVKRFSKDKVHLNRETVLKDNDRSNFKEDRNYDSGESSRRNFRKNQRRTESSEEARTAAIRNRNKPRKGRFSSEERDPPRRNLRPKEKASYSDVSTLSSSKFGKKTTATKSKGDGGLNLDTRKEEVALSKDTSKLAINPDSIDIENKKTIFASEKGKVSYSDPDLGLRGSKERSKAAGNSERASLRSNSDGSLFSSQESTNMESQRAKENMEFGNTAMSNDEGSFKAQSKKDKLAITDNSFLKESSSGTVEKSSSSSTVRIGGIPEGKEEAEDFSMRLKSKPAPQRNPPPLDSDYSDDRNEKIRPPLPDSDRGIENPMPKLVGNPNNANGPIILDEATHHSESEGTVWKKTKVIIPGKNDPEGVALIPSRTGSDTDATPEKDIGGTGPASTDSGKPKPSGGIIIIPKPADESSNPKNKEAEPEPSNLDENKTKKKWPTGSDTGPNSGQNGVDSDSSSPGKLRDSTPEKSGVNKDNGEDESSVPGKTKKKDLGSEAGKPKINESDEEAGLPKKKKKKKFNDSDSDSEKPKVNDSDEELSGKPKKKKKIFDDDASGPGSKPKKTGSEDSDSALPRNKSDGEDTSASGKPKKNINDDDESESGNPGKKNGNSDVPNSGKSKKKKINDDDEDDDSNIGKPKKKKNDDADSSGPNGKPRKKKNNDVEDSDSEKPKKKNGNPDDSDSGKLRKNGGGDDDDESKSRLPEKKNGVDNDSGSGKPRRKNGNDEDDDSDSGKLRKKNKGDDEDSDSGKLKRKNGDDEDSDSKSRKPGKNGRDDDNAGSGKPNKKNGDDGDSNSGKKRKKDSDEDDSDSGKAKRKNGKEDDSGSGKPRKKSSDDEDSDSKSGKPGKNGKDDENEESSKSRKKNNDEHDSGSGKPKRKNSDDEVSDSDSKSGKPRKKNSDDEDSDPGKSKRKNGNGKDSDSKSGKPGKNGRDGGSDEDDSDSKSGKPKKKNGNEDSSGSGNPRKKTGDDEDSDPDSKSGKSRKNGSDDEKGGSGKPRKKYSDEDDTDSGKPKRKNGDEDDDSDSGKTKKKNGNDEDSKAGKSKRKNGDEDEDDSDSDSGKTKKKNANDQDSNSKSGKPGKNDGDDANTRSGKLKKKDSDEDDSDSGKKKRKNGKDDDSDSNSLKPKKGSNSDSSNPGSKGKNSEDSPSTSKNRKNGSNDDDDDDEPPTPISRIIKGRGFKGGKGSPTDEEDSTDKAKPKGNGNSVIANAVTNTGKAQANAVDKVGVGATATALNGTQASSVSLSTGGGDTASRSETYGEGGARAISLAMGQKGSAISTAKSKGEGDSLASSVSKKDKAEANSKADLGGDSEANSVSGGSGDALSASVAEKGGDSRAASTSTGDGTAKAASSTRDGGQSRSIASAKKGGDAVSDSQARRGGTSHSIASSTGKGDSLSNSVTGGGKTTADSFAEDGESVANAVQESEEDDAPYDKDEFADKVKKMPDNTFKVVNPQMGQGRGFSKKKPAEEEEEERPAARKKPKEDPSLYLPAWKTQYSTSLKPNMTLQWEKDAFFGLGSCQRRQVSKWDFDAATTAEKVLKYYMSYLRSYCLEKEVKLLTSLVKDGWLDVLEDNTLQLNDENPLLKSSKLSATQLEDFSIGFELQLFSNLIHKPAGPPSSRGPTSSEISKSVRFLVDFILKGIRQARTNPLTRPHYVHITRQLILVGKVAYTKLFQDLDVLDSCESCVYDKSLNYNDRKEIMALIQFMIKGLSPVDKGENAEESFKIFFSLNENAIEARLGTFV